MCVEKIFQNGGSQKYHQNHEFQNLTETFVFRSSEITDAVTDYFGDSEVHDDSDEWNGDCEAEIEENSPKESESKSLFTFNSLMDEEYRNEN